MVFSEAYSGVCWQAGDPVENGKDVSTQGYPRQYLSDMVQLSNKEQKYAMDS